MVIVYNTGIVDRLERIMGILPPSIRTLEDNLPAGTYFKDDVYIQHIPEDVELAQSEFIKLCHEIGLLSDKFLEGKVHRQGIVGRYLDDSGNKQIYSFWYRFMCIDDNYKEWEQPYYAINYKKHEGNSLNDQPLVVQFFRDRKINTIIDKTK